jgi:hypothetical protein
MTVTFSAYDEQSETFASDADDMDVNMSNANARHLLDALGLDTDDLTGHVPAETFEGAVLLALAINPADEGIPAHELVPGRPNVIDCGRRPGYTEERLGELRTLAAFARERRLTVVWS